MNFLFEDVQKRDTAPSLIRSPTSDEVIPACKEEKKMLLMCVKSNIIIQMLAFLMGDLFSDIASNLA